MLAQKRRPTTITNWGLAELRESTRIHNFPIQLWMLYPGPKFARRQLRRLNHVRGVADRNQQDAAPQGFIEEFRLGLAEREALDTINATGVLLQRLSPAQEVPTISDPIFVARRFVAKTSLVNPFKKTASGRAYDGTESKRDAHMTVFARIDEASPDLSDLEPSTVIIMAVCAETSICCPRPAWR